MLVEFGRAGWIEKARQQPDKVRQAFDKIRADGLVATLEAVKSKLDQPLPLGYCNVGVVAEVGPGVVGLRVGQRVVSNGPHAEMVAVPRQLCAAIPEGVTDDEAAFTVLGAIALQGLRLASPELGERFVVMGLGLIGLVAVQLLRANGCQVLGIDPAPEKVKLARSFGAHALVLGGESDPISAAQEFSGGRGVDGVLITAATRSSDPVRHGAAMCRKRGRIVLVGVTGLELDRSEFYQKELTFQVSCSYGPGRYDPEYEEKGRDYPFGLVRWTEQRNFEAVLELMAAGALNLKELITHRFRFESAVEAYDLLAKGSAPYLGILLEYPPHELRTASPRALKVEREGATRSVAGTKGASVIVSIVGAGNYGARVLIPAFAKTGARLHGIASARGITAAHCARKFGIPSVTTDTNALLEDREANAIVIATRHDSHAELTVRCLRAGKHVFVEKPLALTLDELSAIESVLASAANASSKPILMVGFNRRFAPQSIRMKELLDLERIPRCITATVNAGAIASTHWTQDLNVGGGRLIGEACHFIDLLRFLVGYPITGNHVEVLGRGTERVRGDSVAISLSFADGSWGTVHYVANGHPSFPKERIEVFSAGRILQLDNFRKLRGYGWRGFRKFDLWRQDKGQQACVKSFVDAIESGKPSPIPPDELLEVSRVSIALSDACRA